MTGTKHETKGKTMGYAIKGIISAERACECCGNNNLEKNVVLSNDSGELLYVGTTCAAKMLMGNKKAGSVKTINDLAKWVALADKWLANGHSVADVYQGLRTRTGYALDRSGDTIRFWSRTTNQVMATVN